jgi:hypothetical protein
MAPTAIPAPGTFICGRSRHEARDNEVNAK